MSSASDGACANTALGTRVKAALAVVQISVGALCIGDLHSGQN